MAHGGPRPNAGRKPGQATKINQEARDRAAEGGLMPLDYMLTILRNEELPRDQRFEAAKAAAPYVHAKLANVEASVDLQGDITIRASKEQRDAAVRAALGSSAES